MARTRVLFLAEAVTLAHLARPVELASGLSSAEYEITLACDSRYRSILERLPFKTLPLHSLSSERFLAALTRGRPVYDSETLERYVSDDLDLIDAFKPDLVVGDFRLSLSISARLRQVPYLAISNAYWSPYARQTWPVPALPYLRWAGTTLGSALFRLARPIAFALHTRPLNRVRRRHGLPSLGNDLRRVYTDADYTLYADVPELTPTRDLPAHHRYLGPILWSPPAAPPIWWDALPEGLPQIYLTLGSSGARELLPTILNALANLPVAIMVATAGHATSLSHWPNNTFHADYLPGCEAAARSSLVICNGGSPTTQQALAAGVPVIGIAGNLDQLLNMQAITAAGAGALLRVDGFSQPRLLRLVQTLLNEPRYKQSARQVSGWFAHYPARPRFAQLLEEIQSSG
ncbi:MAG: glycosyltransferase [Pseudomonadota bacterium]|nr:glycosyltransferase [Pseudomonadota bacterium]